jgi:hypothetical protein
MKMNRFAASLGAAVCTLTTLATTVLAADPARTTKAIAPAMPATGEAAPAPAPAPKPVADEPAPNTIYLEGLGAGLAYSLNYERMVVPDVGVRIGFSYLSFGATASDGLGNSESATGTYINIPITASYTGIRSGKHALELGGGTTLSFASGSASGFGMSTSGSGMTPIGDLIVGYRIHPINGAGFNFRVGAMALIGKGLSLSANNPEAVGILPWLYLSLGASF